MNIFFKTFGCKVNQYETELIRSHFNESAMVDDPTKADWCIINSCTVTGESDTKCRHMIKKILRENAQCKVVLTGCYAERSAEELKAISPRVSVIGQSQKNSIPALILHEKKPINASLSRFHNHTRAFVKIQDGCDAFCSYCIVPYVRSKVWSREVSAVISEVKNLIANGYKEIVLTGIRLGKFSHNGTSLSGLITQILALDGDFRLRLSSLEIKEIDDALIHLVKTSDKLCKHLHIPLQSGDDDILKRMNRPYTTDEFYEKIMCIKKSIPNIGITTDVLIGYPGETELQFENTFILINDLEISRLHVFRFSPREGTRAAGEHQPITTREVSMRMNIMKVINAILKKRFADNNLGKECRILPEVKKGIVSGFTDNYIKVNLPALKNNNGFVKGTLIFSKEDGYALKSN